MSFAIQSPVIGPYEIQEEWKKDAFGSLFLAIHQQKRSLHILRILSPDICNQENFIVRFELLKTILPTLEHPNILKVEAMDAYKNIYYIAKEFPGKDPLEIKTLNDFPIHDIPNRFYVFTKLLSGIIEGLQYLSAVSKSYYADGIPFESLHPKFIYLKPKVGAQYTWDRTPKLDAFTDPFLFCGDNPSSLLRYHMMQASDKNIFSHESKKEILLRPFMNSCHSLKNDRVDQNDVQAAFGSIIYEKISGHLPIGALKPLKKYDPACPDLLENVCFKCLKAPYGNGYASFKEVHQDLELIIRQNNRPSSFEKKLEEIKIPSNMSLIALKEKAVLGALDGPTIERPTFKAKIQPFLLDRAPVTNKDFLEFHLHYKRSTYSHDDLAPAALISLHLAQAYCDWRSEKEGLPKGTYRLPTEYEWEASVRGSTEEQYPWGENFDHNLMHVGHSTTDGTCSVFKHPPGRFFLYSMLGNTWEWTSSRFRPHPFSKTFKKDHQSELFVVKGGCWFTPLDHCRASLRAAFSPQERRGNIGFRCARSISI